MNREKPSTAEDIDFTGERVVPGKVDVDLFNEHFVRYEYARSFCSGRKVLDTGCGAGYGSVHLASLASLVVGIDNDLSAVRYARRHHAAQNALYLAGDCQNLPFLAEAFDVVTSFELIEHLPDAQQYLSEIRRVLRKDGTFIVSTPNRPVYQARRQGIANPFHVREWDLNEFAALLKNYFKFIEVRGETHVAALGILGATAGRTTPAVVPESYRLADCDYMVCVASDVPQTVNDLVFVPGSANVLLERERHIDALTKEVQARDEHLARLEPEFEQKSAWANQLNKELAKTRSDYNRLAAQARQYAAQLSKETRWKRLLCFSLLAPVDLAMGAAVVGTELAARAVRPLFRRSAPVAAVSDGTRCSFVIVTWEGKDLLAESLPALIRAAHAHGGDHEIIVVDNGSTDGTESYIQTNFPEVRVIRSERNLYFGGGNNLGIRQAQNDIVVLLNNDMIVHEDFLAPLLQPFREPDVFAVASQVFLADQEKRREETGKTRAIFNGCELEWRHEAILPAEEHQGYVPVFWGHGGAVAVDKNKFLWLGGFDPLYDPFYVEDADISYGAWKVGWRCLLAFNSKVIHKHRSSTSRFGEQFISQIVHRNQYIFFWKNFTDVDKLCAHFLRIPRARMRRAGVPGIGVRVEAKAFLGALKKLPAVLTRRLRLAPWRLHSDQEILDITSNPADETIQAAYIDFAQAPYTEHLGGGWYDLEGREGNCYRWTAAQASVFLRIPEGNRELTIKGHVPAQPSKRRTLTLTVSYSGQQKEFLLQEGPFHHRWQTGDLPGGFPLEIRLLVDQTTQPSGDARTLGLIVESIGFNPQTQSPAKVSRRAVLLHNAAAPDALNAKQKRILMICAYLPCLGRHGGGNMMFNLIKTLSSKHRITVLSFYEQESELEDVPALAPFCEKLEVIYRGQNFQANDLFGLKPPEITREFYHGRMERLIRQQLATQKFDVIQCEYLQTAHFAAIAPQLPAVLTNHEVLSLAYEKRFQALSWGQRGKLKAMIAWMRMLNYEEQVLKRFSAVVVLTEPEARFLSRYAPQVPVFCHPMGVDCDYFAPTPATAPEQSVVFVGNFRHSPNVNGALWLLEKVWPRIRARCSQVQLYIVGGHPTKEIEAHHGKNGVVVTGWVKDVRSHLARAAVVVAPLFQGAGMRTKVLEAWAMEKAVVGTQLALEGLAKSNGELCFITDDEEEFATRTCELLENKDLAVSVGARARRHVRAEFSWEAFAEHYDKIYAAILPATSSRSAIEMISTGSLEHVSTPQKIAQR